MHICNKCGLVFKSKSGLSSHIFYNKNNALGDVCRTKKNIIHSHCKFCNKIINGRALGGHVTWCELNSNRNRTKELCGNVWRGRHHSKKTRDVISKKLVQYLIKNPDKVPYVINHSSNKSYPEFIFETELNNFGIKNWTYHYRNGIYQYDFAFVELKIDVEIDGQTHLTEKVKQIDKKRDEFSKKCGWTVVRFSTREIRNDIRKCIDRLQVILHESVAQLEEHRTFNARVTGSTPVGFTL